jgi:hypothetical protein
MTAKRSAKSSCILPVLSNSKENQKLDWGLLLTHYSFIGKGWPITRTQQRSGASGEVAHVLDTCWLVHEQEGSLLNGF